MAIGRGNFGDTLFPGLRKIFGLSYRERAAEYSRIFQVENSQKYREDLLSVGGFGLAPEMDSGDSVTYMEAKQNWVHSTIHTKYGAGFIVENDLYDDEMYGTIRALPAALAQSMRATVETVDASYLNNGFASSTAGDGVLLFSASHLLGEGGTFRNMPSVSADLDATSLEQALLDIGGWVNDAGLQMDARPKMLVVSKENEWNCVRLFGTAQDVGTAYNDKNPAYNLMPWMVCHYLTDTDAWFIVTDVPNGLVHYWRRKPDFTKDNDFDTENAKYKSIMRFSRTCHDPRGVYGNAGA